MQDSKKKKVAYIVDENLLQHCNRLPAVENRASLVHELIRAYKLCEEVKVVSSTPATYNDLKEFHSELYLDHLKKFTDVDEEEYTSCAQDEEYGLGYDCAPISNMFDLVSALAGGTITAAKCLVLGYADVAINWCGGWHHAHRFGADGFCYVNDIVLGINTLRRKFPKILYVDLDVHHGNGVQDAFDLSSSVFTLSFHKYEPGFYPGSGALEDIGKLSGKGYSCNVPLKAGYTDDTMIYMFDKVFEKVYSLFVPDAIVMQCGGDALPRDPCGGAALSARGYSHCLRRALRSRRPVLLLGGGGYESPNTARLWASLTALAAGVPLPTDIPEHGQWTRYGPSYTRDIEPALARDCNDRAYLDDCLTKIFQNLDKYLGKKSTSHNNSETKCEDKERLPKINNNAANSNDAPAKNIEDVYEFTED